MPIHTKIRVREALPADLIEMMKEVELTTEEGDYDDLLQWNNCVGGLTDTVKRQFSFAYFPIISDGHADVSKMWDILFSQEQIHAIATGALMEIELWRCETDCGNRFWNPESHCQFCDSGKSPAV